MNRLALLSCLTVACTVSSFADESATNNTVLPPVIVTGTRIPIELAETPTTVTIISRDQIDALQENNVADVLRDVADVNVVRVGQPGQETSVFMRGADSDQTLVLIDGVRVNNPFNNAFNFAFLPVDNIDRIEVLRGPQSTLYGSEALGGVINIVTKEGSGPPSGSIVMEGGTADSLQSQAAFAMSSGKLSLSAEGGYFSSDNERINSDTFTWDAAGHATYRFLDSLSASLLATYTQSAAGSPGDQFANDPNDKLYDETTLVALTVNGQLTDWWNTRLILSYDHEHLLFNEPAPNPPYFYPAYLELTTTDREEIDFQNIFRINEKLQLLLGGTFDHSVANDTNSYSTVDREIDDEALYTQIEYNPIPRLTATAGGRVDDYTSFGTHGTYRLGLRGTIPDTETILRTSVGTGFKAPSVVQLTTAYGGNPDLLPEESLGWDAGVEQPLVNGQLHIGSTYFQNEFKNLIISTNVPPPIYSELINAGRARIFGLENFISWKPFTNLTLRGTFTWLAEARDLTANQPLIRRPEYSGSVAAEYRFLKRFTADLNAALVGERHDTNFDTGQSVIDDAYTKLDIGLRYDVCQHFSIFGRIENLLGEHYEEAFGYPALGRMFWAGADMKF